MWYMEALLTPVCLCERIGAYSWASTNERCWWKNNSRVQSSLPVLNDRGLSVWRRETERSIELQCEMDASSVRPQLINFYYRLSYGTQLYSPLFRSVNDSDYVLNLHKFCFLMLGCTIQFRSFILKDMFTFLKFCCTLLFFFFTVFGGYNSPSCPY